MNITIVRHAQTDWNSERRVQGRQDIKLNNLGMQQAKQLEKRLPQDIDIIITSPLTRAVQTAKIINENRNLEIKYDERVIERNYGEYEGKTYAESNAREFWDYNGNYKYVKAENIRDFFKRIYDFMDCVKVEYSGKNILIITHGGVTIPINCYFNGMPKNNDLPSLLLEHNDFITYSFS